MENFDKVGMNIVDGREHGGLSHRWPCPPLCCPPSSCPQPIQSTATAENALAYAVCEHTADPGNRIPYEVFEINAAGGSIRQAGSNTLVLQPGVYAVTFMSDAAGGMVPPEENVGAALSLSGGKVAFAETLLQKGSPEDARVALNTILKLTVTDTLFVVNNTNHKVSYENTSLTVIRLSG